MKFLRHPSVLCRFLVWIVGKEMLNNLKGQTFITSYCETIACKFRLTIIFISEENRLSNRWLQLFRDFVDHSERLKKWSRDFCHEGKTIRFAFAKKAFSMLHWEKWSLTGHSIKTEISIFIQMTGSDAMENRNKHKTRHHYWETSNV